MWPGIRGAVLGVRGIGGQVHIQWRGFSSSWRTSDDWESVEMEANL